MRQVTGARTSETFEGTYECKACGFEAPVLVYGSGRGTAGGWGRDSAAAALADASQDAGDVAAWTLVFVPCPSCGKRDPIARSYVITAIVLAVLGGLGFGALFGVLVSGERLFDGGALKLAVLAAAVIVALAIFLAKARAFIGIRRRVAFDLARATGIPPATVVRR